MRAVQSSTPLKPSGPDQLLSRLTIASETVSPGDSFRTSSSAPGPLVSRQGIHNCKEGPERPSERRTAGIADRVRDSASVRVEGERLREHASVDATAKGWDGSLMRTVAAPDGRSVEVWDAARVVAGEMVQLCIVGVGDVGRHAYRWNRVAQRWAGVPFWGSGPPPVPAIGTGRDAAAQPPLGFGPDGADVWSQPHRFVAVPGSRGDRLADDALLKWVCVEFGPVDVVLGHGEGGRLAQTADTGDAIVILLDGGVPVGLDRDDAELRHRWDDEAPNAVLVPAARPTRYEPQEVAQFMAQHPATPWLRLGGLDQPGIDHDRIVDSDWSAMVLPGLVGRLRSQRRP